MRLQINMPAPDFHAQLVDGSALTLSSLRGQRVHLAFHRYASCPICNYSLRQFEQRQHELQQHGIVYLPVFHSPARKMHAFYPELPSFPIIVDPQRTLYRLYGLSPSIWPMLHPRTMKDMTKLFASIRAGFHFRVAVDGPILTSPGDFLLDQNGVIVAAHYGNSIGDSWSPDDLLAQLP